MEGSDTLPGALVGVGRDTPLPRPATTTRSPDGVTKSVHGDSVSLIQEFPSV